MKLANFKKQWGLYSQFGIWVASLISAFMIPFRLYEYRTDWLTKFTQFLGAAIAGILFVLILRYKQKKFVFHWWIASLVLFIISIGLIINYTSDFDTYTVRYAGSNTVIGDSSHIFPQAKARWAELAATYGRPLTTEEIVKKAAGYTGTIWYPSFLRHRRHILMIDFSLIFLFLPAFIITVVQAAFCQSLADKPNKKQSGTRSSQTLQSP